jgi:fatty acid desaturase
MTFMFFLPRKKIIQIGNKTFGNQFNHNDKLQHFSNNHLKKHIEGSKLVKLRMDFILSLCLLVTMFFIYNQLMLLFISYLLIRALLFSYFDNMPHYATELHGDINAARNSYLPKTLALLFMNFNYHKLHHELPVLSWYYLPEEFKKANHDYDDHLIRDFFDQFKGRVMREQLLPRNRPAISDSSLS